MRILLADDQNEIRLLTVEQLRQAGHAVVDVPDGASALAEFDRSPFDVVLLDEHMPAPNGIDVLRAIRAKRPAQRQIVIALTGYNTEPDRVRLLREGFDSVIGKPFRLQQLEATLLSLLDARRLAPVETAPPPGSAPTIAGDILRSVGGDKKLLLRMIQIFLRDTPKRLAEIEAAIHSDRSEDLAFSAHALKGSVAIFGAEAARQQCQELQELGRRAELSRVGPAFEQLKVEIAKLEANLRGYAGQTSLSTQESPETRKRPGSGARRKPR